MLAEPVRALEAYRASWVDNEGDLRSHGIWGIYDGVSEAETADDVQNNCYVSLPGIKPWIQFFIPWSLVSHVDIYGPSNGSSNYFISSVRKPCSTVYLCCWLILVLVENA